MSRRFVVLCADDYGISEGVSRGIVDLAQSGRISATSVMANMPAWPGAAPALRRFDGRIGMGLHLTLTWGQPLGPMPVLAPNGVFPSLATVLKLSLTGRLPADEIAAEIARQAHAFTDALGREPDFVDGHQHVHVLPSIRGALLSAFQRRPVWVRDPRGHVLSILERRSEIAKALFVGALARGFRADAERHGLRTNRGFSGFSDFAPTGDLDAAFDGYLTAPGLAPLVMCHPGYVDETAGLDAIVAARGAEQAYLASPEFGALLARRTVTLVREPRAS